MQGSNLECHVNKFDCNSFIIKDVLAFSRHAHYRNLHPFPPRIASEGTCSTRSHCSPLVVFAKRVAKFRYLSDAHTIAGDTLAASRKSFPTIYYGCTLRSRRAEFSENLMSGTEMVHGRARAPPRQTWRVAL